MAVIRVVLWETDKEGVHTINNIFEHSVEENFSALPMFTKRGQFSASFTKPLKDMILKVASNNVFDEEKPIFSISFEQAVK